MLDQTASSTSSDRPEDQFRVSAPQLTLPKGGGAIRGIGEKYSANASMGTGSVSVPLFTSPGRAGFGPKLSLTYDSGAGNGAFGLGWRVSIPSITRKTDKGLPLYSDADESDIFILSGAEDLVPALVRNGTQWQRDISQRAVFGRTYEVRRYRPRIEGLFARIERWTNQDDPRDMFWRSITNDNITSWYGKTAESRIADPSDPTRIFTWLISETYDDKGNACSYVYKAEDSTGVDTSQANERNRTDATRATNRYLKRALWNNRTPYLPDLSAAAPAALPTDWCFELVFDYGEHDPNVPTPRDNGAWTCRPDPFSTYRSTFEVRTYRLCNRALMFHHFQNEPDVGLNCLVRSTDFAYQPASADPSAPFYSCVVSIAQTGYRRQGAGYFSKSMPPLEFEYRQCVIDETVRELDATSLENLPNADGVNYQWIDLDGEGSPGILTEQDGAWFYKRNWSPANQRNDGGVISTRAQLGPVEVVRTRASLTALSTGRQQLLDLAGDGNQDLVQFGGGTPGFFERTADGGWQEFTTFRSLPVTDWSNPDLKFIDVTGDGHSDLLISEDNAFRWHASLGQDGFGEGQRIPQSRDEEKGPRVVFSDGTETIFLADVSGDGLSDVVRVRNGEVCYWPNMGYGRFGAKVAMDGAPWFDRPELFDARRIRLADIDGSGTADIVYFAHGEVRLYFNQSGNAWGARRLLSSFPQVESVSSASALDLLGNGTACLVWSSPLAGNLRRPIRYIDLMGGQKPHLLVRVTNNLGAETRIQYAPSTKFYVADRLAGTPWLTRLPFPVQVVERVDTYDYVNRNRFVSRYAYHHGYFDGVEREFRGFGRVEHFDTEEFASLDGSTVFPQSANVDASSHVPPVCTKTWFHTGAYFGEGKISKQLEVEYYHEGLTDQQLEAMLLDDTVLPDSVLLADGTRVPQDFSPEELREACRSLRGSILRQEVYAADGTSAAERPYRVSENNYTIEALQPQGPNRFGAFFSHARETVDFSYERTLYDVAGQTVADPRVSHNLTFAVDAFGNVLESASVGYGRRYADSALSPAAQSAQSAILCTFTANRYTNAVDQADARRTPMAAETSTYELLQVQPASSETGVTNLFRFDELQSKADAAGDGAHEILFENLHPVGLNAGQPYRRLIARTRTLYRPDDMGAAAGNANTLLPLLTLEPLALPGDRYRLAFTPGLVTQVYQRGGALLPTPATVLGSVLDDGGGYVDLDGDGHWWIPSGRIFYLDAPDTPQNEKARAVQHFYVQRRFEDAFGNATAVNFDTPHDLLPVGTRDAAGNGIVAVNDYRTLHPALITDPNGNQSAASFDALGIVTGTALMGKPGENIGDSLTGFTADLTQAQIDGFYDAVDPQTLAGGLLANATSRIVSDPNRFYASRLAAPNDPTQWQPSFGALIVRETHVSDLVAGQTTRTQIKFSYSDGFGRETQTKTRVEPGPVVDGGPVVNPRWAASGWSILTNKGKPVRKYEPFFSQLAANGHQFEFGVLVGVSPILFYDPLGRAVGTLNPNHSYQKVVFDPWRQETWDANDTVLQADPTTDPDIGDFFQRLPVGEYSPTWQTQRAGGGLGAQEQDAAVKAAAHASTPAVAHLDSLGRTSLTVLDNAAAGKFATQVELDIQGNQRSITDPLGRIAALHDYNVAGSVIRQSSMDAGVRWMLADAADKPIRAWDDRGHNVRASFDMLRRPVGLFVLGTDMALSDPRTLAAEALYEMTVYGDGHPQDQALNLRTRILQHFDCAGVVTNQGHNAAAGRDEAYDFKGNLLRSSRQFLADPQALPDWAGAPPVLEADIFTSNTTFDAVNRPMASTTPDSSVTNFAYDTTGFVKQIDANLLGAAASTPFVTDIDYDAHGRRKGVAFGNTAATSYQYDPLIFRLSRLTTTRQGVPANQQTVQDLTYTFDPSDNITHVQDDADIQNVVFFRNRRVEPSADYTYDAIYRLIAASGREFLGNAAGVMGAPAPTSYNDSPRVGLAHPGDGNAIGTYTEQYQYDDASNLLQWAHRGADPANPGWTRTFSYTESSLIEPPKKGNRLARTTIASGGGPLNEDYTHDVHGNMIAMPQLQTMTWDFKDRLAQTRRQAVNASDADGNLHQGERTFYVYDAAGNRARKATLRPNGTLKNQRFYLGGVEIYREFDAAGTTVTLERQTLHIMDDNHRVAIVESKTVDAAAAPGALPASAIRYQFGNHLDSASLELDDAGAVISYEEYYPFGSTSYQAGRSMAEVSLKRYRYTGKERDEETGLQYNRNRYYACWLGRWTAADPAGLGDGPNLYSYVSNNPIRLRDPNGTDGNDALHPNDPPPPPGGSTTTVTVTDPQGNTTSSTTTTPPPQPPAPDAQHPPPIFLAPTVLQPWRGVPRGVFLHEYTLSLNGALGGRYSHFGVSGSGGVSSFGGSVRYGAGWIDFGPIVGVSVTDGPGGGTGGGILGATAHIPIDLGDDKGIGIYLSPLATFSGPLHGGAGNQAYGGSAVVSYGREPLPGEPGASWDLNGNFSYANNGTLIYPASPTFNNLVTFGGGYSYGPASDDDHISSAVEGYLNVVHGDPSSGPGAASTWAGRVGVGYSHQYSERLITEQYNRTNSYLYYFGVMAEVARVNPVVPMGAMPSSSTDPYWAFTVMAIANFTIGGNIHDHH
jgi:RHS repeat-associated protein